MGGSGQPYLYEAASARNSAAFPFNDFNPRAATQAHYQAQADRAERHKYRQSQQGQPLIKQINFNAHPDSYLPVQVQPKEHVEISPNTKRNVVWTRWLQLALRVVQEIGALGILVCVICLKMKQDAPSWMIRIAPAWDALVTIYAIYHLARPAKGRTPGTSASYHLFALFMDTGLVPFFVLIALFTRQNWTPNPDLELRWTSFFKTEKATEMMIHVLFYGSIGMGGLHLLSMGIDIYLIAMFRKIGNMPPDMNPLEDNLTGSLRQSSRHKYKNSEATFSSLSTDDLDEKKPGYLSGSTLSLDKGPQARVIPFGHSRMDSNDEFSPHNPNSARLSRQQYEDFSLYQGPQSARDSRHDIGSVPSPTLERSSSPYQLRDTPNRHTTAPTNANVKSQQREGLLNDNWYAQEEQMDSDLGTPRSRRGPDPSRYPEPTLPNVEIFQPLRLKPLTGNPLTPPLEEEFAVEHRDVPGAYDTIEKGVARTMTVASHTTNASSVYSESAPALSMIGQPAIETPKSKHYGDLASATRGVHGAAPAPQINLRPARERLPQMKTYGIPTPVSSRTPSPQKNSPRVVSRTGADITDGHVQGAGSGYSMRDRRDHPGDTTPPKVRASRTVAIATHREAFQRAVVQHGGSERGVVWAVSTPPGGEVKMPEMQQQQQRSNFLLAAATTNNAAAHAPTSSDEPESIPPWVHINEQDEQAPFLSPAPVVPNSRHYKPPQGNYKPGRKLDQFRNAEPGLLSTRIDQHQQRWIPFMQSSPMPHEHRDIRIIRSPQWMEENVPISSRKWEPEDEISPETNRRLGGLKGFMFRGKWLISPERQEKTVKLYWRLLLKNAFVPLVFRITVLAFSCAALGVAGTILHAVNKVNGDNDINNQCAPRASTYMGIIVSAIAVPYVGYVTWDEYLSKPLGLRSVAAKTALLLCDLYFIVFSASNLSLAFSALEDDSWACFDANYQTVGDVQIQVPRTCPNNSSICSKQRALSGVLIITLVAWLLCFSISVLRVVEKLRLEY
ncbi:unnamed protein product [Zymoseptoria tritici ST99CH_3D7]|uniref:Uncharacterized protein n=3 Tax=Zymoseptoria tritici TaxID=1047171 RepID=A0A1X7S4X7_ZYMT9|nr:unnamed protein product [Zymoseptoria tritici ST99CH_3D7]SMR59174.1 unnamed protein product [Zymoseptoria tritici ST99CH_1E4]